MVTSYQTPRALTSDLTERYHISDFTLREYHELLQLAKRNYVFRGFQDFQRDERFILWRHDLDLSPHSARNLARIEAELGVRATYFVNPHSEFYNLFEREVTDCIRDIIACGHDLGLHFDVHYHGISAAGDLDQFIRKEARLLEDVFQRSVGVFSFHNTNEFTMASQDWTYGGLVNTYAQYFQKEVGYCSDSNGFWRFRRLREVLELAVDDRLQVLTHDGWWQEQPLSPRARVYRSILGRAAKTSTSYADLLDRMQRPNITELSDTFELARTIDPQLAFRLESLWFSGYPWALLLELRRVHGRQLTGISRAHLAKTYGVAPVTVDNLFAQLDTYTSREIFQLATVHDPAAVTGMSDLEDRQIIALLEGSMRGVHQPAHDQALASIDRLTSALRLTAEWGLDSQLACDGFDDLRDSPVAESADLGHAIERDAENAEWNGFVREARARVRAASHEDSLGAQSCP